jgi:radical SAM superfamily enzyme YgiQ (UPF0313 family)
MSGADMLVYGMGEMPLREIIRLLKKGVPFRIYRHRFANRRASSKRKKCQKIKIGKTSGSILMNDA